MSTDETIVIDDEQPEEPGPVFDDDGDDHQEIEKTKPWYRRWPAITALAVVVLAGVYVGLAALVASRVPAGTHVWGVNIGSMTAAEARETLETEIGTLLGEPVEVSVAHQSAVVVPAEAGIDVDYDATVSDLTGFSLDPRRVVRALFGSGDIEPVTAIDDDALKDAMQTVAGAVDQEPIDANIVFEDGKPVVTEPEDGIELEQDAAGETFVAEFYRDAQPVELPSAASTPAIDADQLEKVQTEIVDPFLSGPIIIVVEEERAEMEPAELTEFASIDMAKAELNFEVDKLKALAQEKLPALRSTGTDARIVMENGKPVIVPSKSGTSIDADDFLTQVKRAATSSEKEVTPEFADADADFSTEDAKALGVKEIVGSFDTPLTADQVRTTNLIVGTKAITNTLVKPGETFSLLNALGPVTYERGFVDSGVVNNGFATQALGGGLSQLSTTTMNAAFFAGMDLVEFRQHTRYFSRYPEGREATLWGPSLDMKWKNNTDYGILVDAYVANNRVYVRLWSTKVWDVEAWTSPRRNLTQPQLVYNNRADCVPENGTTPGFTVDFGRKRYKNGSLVDSQSWTWTYDAWPIVRCGSPD
ncbi:MAG: VanW family protein [Bowdeniella nasicola]|nr:VanW family protein [Bowdeniella nasicola]